MASSVLLQITYLHGIYVDPPQGTGSLLAPLWPEGAPPPQCLSQEAACVGPQGLGTLPAVERDKGALAATWRGLGLRLRYFTPKVRAHARRAWCNTLRLHGCKETGAVQHHVPCIPLALSCAKPPLLRLQAGALSATFTAIPPIS